MFRLNKLTDYALVVLTQMAVCPGRQAYTASELSEQTGLPSPTVTKILKQLARHRVVRAQRGARGGYRLARRPEDVTVADVIEAVDGPIRIADCLEADPEDGTPGRCLLQSACPTRDVWQRVNDAITSSLSGLTLHDVCEKAVVRPTAEEGMTV